MVLVDTSLWVDHLSEGNPSLGTELNEGTVVCHPFIIGEIACGTIRNRIEILSLLQSLSMAETVEHNEVMQFIEHNKLAGKGLSYVDMHLLASAVLTRVPLWTFDKQLKQASVKLRINYRP